MTVQDIPPRRSAGRRLRRVLLWVSVVVLVVLIGLGMWLAPMLYRVYHGLDVYETVPPALPAALPEPAILIFSKTNGFREDRAILAANKMFRDIARERGWGVFVTENAAVFNPEQLSRFRAVVWNNASGDVLTLPQRKAFRAYLEAGGGYVGVHGAGGDHTYRWRWYGDDLIGAHFISHTMFPQIQRATIRIADPAHPAMAGLPPAWPRADEWYSFDRSVRARGYRVLATLDEKSYQPTDLFGNDIRMGDDHPIIWTHCVGRGRAYYSALGHAADAYAEPLVRRSLANAVAWAASEGACRNGL
ncbi:ThuA domain-containing protein [Sphingomonas solaris]|uniref:ThuA domain-containing protein n=1 Tax=Alterirhizorhabdus solaris TaxID=2529389 RepID=UPI00139686E3|nr:ThuA domain-containing protein [Sphingomonas solaris]